MSEIPEGLMTMRQAEAWLRLKPSFRGMRLRRILTKIEKKTGREVMTRLGDQGYRVTRSALRRFCRHLLPSKVDELRDNLGEFMRGIDEKIEASVAHHVAEHVEPQLEQIWQRDETQAEAIRQLSERVKRIAGIRVDPSAKERQGAS